MAGHLFVINGDISRLKCDAWLLPSDPAWMITGAFAHVVGETKKARFRGAPASGWPDNGMYLLREGDGSNPDIWLGDVGRSEDFPIEHYGQCARRFAKVAVDRIRRERAELLSDQRRNPIIAFNVLGSGDGGKRSQRGALLAALIPTLLEIAAEEIDVVLVCYGPVMYSAAQNVRKKVFATDTSRDAWGELSSDLQSKAKQLAEKAQRGELVLFLGAGISVDSNVPAWQPLLSGIAREGGMSDQQISELKGFDPRDQGTILQAFLGIDVRSAVAERMKVERYGLVHGLLSSLPIREVVTTNFDQLFESACTASSGSLAVLPGDAVRSDQRWLLKLHGDIGSSIVLTRGDYHTALATQTALRGIVQAMLMTRQMVFIGYSLRDEDFHQLVHEVRFARSDPATNLGTALVLESSTLTSELWKDVDFVSMGMKPTETEEEARIETFQAARRLWIFLDLIGLLSVSELPFLTDTSFDHIKTLDEAFLGRIAGELAEFLASTPGEWPEIRQFLRRFEHYRD